MGLDARLVFLLLAVCLFCVFVFRYKKNQVILSLRPEESMGGEKKTNRDANQVDEEHNRRASIFLPINPLKISTSRFDSFATCWGKDILHIGIYPSLVTRLSRS